MRSSSPSATTTTMDFFGQQARSRRRTFLLVVLLALAVLIITALAYPVFALLVAWYGPHGGSGEREADWAAMWEMMWRTDMVLGVGAGVLLLVLGSAAVKIRQLARGGGQGVAESLGGRLLDPETTDADERKVLNVVEEMSIASGMTVPPIYIMQNERAINAFAAGFTSEDAVIGVTRGAVEHLSRDELQGVIAHEFSHILNGDMRVNIRLTGIVHGLMVLALIGYAMLRSGGRRRYSSSRRGGGGGGALLGVVLIVLGMVGVFFGRAIKAAVSRQREFLADAAAVQFTRNPAGLAGALKKIGGHYRGARLDTEKAEEASHMFFGRGVVLGAMLDSHPPLKTRIRRIDPAWDGAYTTIRRPARATEQTASADAGGGERDRSVAEAMAGAGAAEQVVKGAVIAGTLAERVAAAQATARADANRLEQHEAVARRALDQIGRPTAAHLAYARQLREAIPGEVAAAVHETGGGRAVIYALLLHKDEAVRDAQLQRLEEHAEPAACELTRRVAPLIAELGEEVRLPLIDLAMPALRRLTAEQYGCFRANMDHLIRADRRVSLFEWMLRRVVLHDLEPRIAGTPRPRVRYYSLRRLGEPIGCVLSTIAYLGADDQEEAQQMYRVGASVLEIDPPPMWERGRCKLKALDEAVDRLAETGLRQKRTVLHAAAACIAANQRVSPREAELLRAFSDALDVPMPPLLPGQQLA